MGAAKEKKINQESQHQVEHPEINTGISHSVQGLHGVTPSQSRLGISPRGTRTCCLQAQGRPSGGVQYIAGAEQVQNTDIERMFARKSGTSGNAK